MARSQKYSTLLRMACLTNPSSDAVYSIHEHLALARVNIFALKVPLHFTLQVLYHLILPMRALPRASL